MRGRFAGGLRHRIDGRRWRMTALVALLLPPGLAAQERPAAPTARAEAPQGRTHTVKRGDTLWDLAHSYLGDAFQWPEIYRVNRDVIENPHWIYPGEVLVIPDGKGLPAVAEPEAEPAAPAPAPEPAPAPVVEDRVNPNAPTVFSPAPPRAANELSLVEEERAPVVRAGEIVAAPWVDVEGAPVNPGHILGSRELPGIALHGERVRYQVYEDVLVTLPSGAAGAVGDRLVAVRKGPKLEEMGQVLIPTAMLEVIRPPRNGEAAIARVMKLFEGLSSDHRLLAFNPNVLRVGTTLAPATAGERIEGHIRWIQMDPVLPSVGRFAVLDIGAARGLHVGDQLEVYVPREEIKPDAPLRPETPVARLQVLRVTALGATAVILGQAQPLIEVGQGVRRMVLMR